MRLFIAINFNEEAREILQSFSEKTKKDCLDGRFTRRENLHLTLIFLGEIAGARGNDVKKVLRSVSFSPFTLRIKGAGMFGSHLNSTLWVGLEKNKTLSDIHDFLLRALRAEGFHVEKRGFLPHITIARSAMFSDERGREAFLCRAPLFDTPAPGISLMRSDRFAGKLVYTEIDKKIPDMPARPV